MEWIVWMLAVAVLGLAAVATTGRLGELPATVTSTPVSHLPAGRIGADELRAVRFEHSLHGYSTPQVDELLDRLAYQLDSTAREARPPVS